MTPVSTSPLAALWPGRNCRWCSPARFPPGRRSRSDGPSAPECSRGPPQRPGPHPSRSPAERSPPMRANSPSWGVKHRDGVPPGVQYIYMSGQGIYAVGVQHHRLPDLPQQVQHQLRDALTPAQPGADGHRVTAGGTPQDLRLRLGGTASRACPAGGRAWRRHTWPPPPARWPPAPPGTPDRTRSAPPPRR